jgi:hypothetical protein
MRSVIKIPDRAGVESHQLRTYEVRCNSIIGENDLAEALLSSVQGSVALHGDNAIRDNEVDRPRGADIENATMHPFPVENILQSAILGAFHNAEHIYYAERHSGPVVRFDLGHRHDEVGRRHGPR